MRLQGTDLDQLALAAEALVRRIEAVDGASDLSSSFALGAETINLETNDFGRALGLSNDTIGGQMRAALNGQQPLIGLLRMGRSLEVRFTYAPSDQGQIF